MRLLPTNGIWAQVDDEDFFPCLKYTWYIDSEGYVRTSIFDKGKITTLRLHVSIQRRMGLTGMFDHKDRNKLNCQRDNLRIATTSQNMANIEITAANTSGVSWCNTKGKWHAQISYQGKSINLGYFTKIESAIEARKQGVLKYHGEFAP